jgi:hypothetical protein
MFPLGAAMHRARGEFVLRAEFKGGRTRRLGSVAAGFIAIGLCAGLSACADDANYPSLAKIADVGAVMTPEERQKAMEDLQKQSKASRSEPVKTASSE